MTKKQKPYELWEGTSFYAGKEHKNKEELDSTIVTNIPTVISTYTKTCSQCGEKKIAETYFNKKTCTKDGYQPKCKSCESIRHKLNSDKRSAIMKQRMDTFLNASVDDVRKVVHYNEHTGLFYNCDGNPIMFNCGTRYVQVWVKEFGVKLWAHRLAWFLMTGEWAEMIDHKNGNGRDNRFVNLRACTGRENGHNQYKHRAGKYAGAHLCSNPNCHRWIACTRIDGKYVYIGLYLTEKEASMAYFLYLYQHGLIREEFIPEEFREDLLMKVLDIKRKV